jgi:hypothetical protein
LKRLQETLDGSLKHLQATQQPFKKQAGKIFVLRGGKEQRDLTHDQFTFEEKEDGSIIVTYSQVA